MRRSVVRGARLRSSQAGLGERLQVLEERGGEVRHAAHLRGKVAKAYKEAVEASAREEAAATKAQAAMRGKHARGVRCSCQEPERSPARPPPHARRRRAAGSRKEAGGDPRRGPGGDPTVTAVDRARRRHAAGLAEVGEQTHARARRRCAARRAKAS